MNIKLPKESRKKVYTCQLFNRKNIVFVLGGISKLVTARMKYEEIRVEAIRVLDGVLRRSQADSQWRKMNRVIGSAKMNTKNDRL